MTLLMSISAAEQATPNEVVRLLFNMVVLLTDGVIF
jgi:hypothetical protein